MIEVRLRNGTTFMADEAEWTVVPPGSQDVYGWKDVEVIGLAEIGYEVTQGHFGPPGRPQMPIRGLRFFDPSDLRIEVPMPLAVAREIGELLSTSKIEVVQHLPAALLLGRGFTG